MSDPTHFSGDLRAALDNVLIDAIPSHLRKSIDALREAGESAETIARQVKRGVSSTRGQTIYQAVRAYLGLGDE